VLGASMTYAISVPLEVKAAMTGSQEEQTTTSP
jgi:hypothetical protein